MTPLLATLRTLEAELHGPELPDAARLQALLHADFREFGRSGACYTRAQMLELLRTSTSTTQVHAQDFVLMEPAPGIALLTYRSAHLQPDGSMDRHSNRMSLWKHEASGWQMIFHQGTPTEPFGHKD